MTWRDKLEIGWQENAADREDNLPLTEVIGTELPQGDRKFGSPGFGPRRCGPSVR
jgi:hypothetical protein